MLDVFSLANSRIAVALNHGLFAHPPLFNCALFASESGANLLIFLTLAALWVAPAPQNAAESKPGSKESKPGSRRASGNSIVRLENRARIITFIAAAMLAYLLARLVAHRFDLDRPFATFLPIQGPRGVFNGVRAYGSFPSAHATLLGALPAALWFWRRRFAWAWALLAIVLATARVAVGYHYPFDMAGGAALGALIVVYVLRAQAREGTFQALTQSAARAFEPKSAPYHYLSYALLLLVAVEFSSNFRHVLGVLQNAPGEAIIEDSSWRRNP